VERSGDEKMIKIAYLVFAYKNPQLLKRVLSRLSTDHCAFFVHIDQKIDITQFSCIRGENVFFCEKRVLVHWGEFSGVRAVLLLLEQALSRPAKYDYFVLLSGSEYPLRSAKYIHRFLESNRGLEFISILKMPSPGKPMSRISTRRLESDTPVRRFVWRVLAKVGLANRDYGRYCGTLVPYSGITWWALSRAACEYVVQFTNNNPHVARFFRDTFAPEESFIHTILGNSPLRDRICGNFLFEDWTPPGGDPHRCVRGQLPQYLTGDHIASFEAQERVGLEDCYGCREALFARKFSDDTLDLLDQLDAMIARKEEFAEFAFSAADEDIAARSESRFPAAKSVLRV
jgi:hypothetical protein